LQVLLTAAQVVRVTHILSSARIRPEDLDAWDLALTCGHTVRSTQHRDHDRYSGRVAECAACGQRHGVITAERIGPAGDPDRQVARDRLSAGLAQAQAKLDRQLKATAAAERKVGAQPGQRSRCTHPLVLRTRMAAAKER
jgi:hypothetical protein